MTAKPEATQSNTGPAQTDRGTQPHIRPYDFAHPDRLSRYQLRALEAMHREAARATASKFSTTAVGHAELQISGISQMRAQDLAAGMPEPTIIEILALSPLAGSGLLQVDLEVGFAMINLLLGGRRTTQAPGRPLTELEHSVLSGVTSLLLSSLSEVWRKLAPLELSVVGTAHMLNVSQLGQPQDPLLVVGFRLTAAGSEGTVTFVLPLTALERAHVLEFGRSQSLRDEPEPDSHALKAAQSRRSALLADLSVRCRAELASLPLTLGQLAELQVGDLLLLRPASDPCVEFRAGDGCRLRGRLLTEQRRLAVEILPDESRAGGRP